MLSSQKHSHHRCFSPGATSASKAEGIEFGFASEGLLGLKGKNGAAAGKAEGKGTLPRELNGFVLRFLKIKKPAPLFFSKVKTRLKESPTCNSNKFSSK